MSSICSDIFNIDKCKLKNREKPKSYNYIYTVISVVYYTLICPVIIWHTLKPN